MLKSPPGDLAGSIDSIVLEFAMEQSLTPELPAIQNWYVIATTRHWDDADHDGDPHDETVARINIVKGSLVHGSLWDQLDAIEADLEAVARAVLDVRSGDLRQEVLDRIDGLSPSLLILNSVTLARRWRGYGSGRCWPARPSWALTVKQSPPTRSAGRVTRRGAQRAIRKLQRVWAQLRFKPRA